MIGLLEIKICDAGVEQYTKDIVIDNRRAVYPIKKDSFCKLSIDGNLCHKTATTKGIWNENFNYQVIDINSKVKI